MRVKRTFLDITHISRLEERHRGVLQVPPATLPRLGTYVHGRIEVHGDGLGA